MALWRIKAYHLEAGSCPIQDWYVAQDPEVQAAFDASLTILRATADWLDTWQFKKLTKTHVGLGEMRFKLEGRPLRRFRPVGIWPPIVEREFILLLGCEKRQRIYIPPNAFRLALDFRRELEAGRGTIRDYI